MVRYIKRALQGMVLLCALVFALDYAWARYRLSRGDALSTVEVESYFAVREKDGKTEFMRNPPRPETCVHSLLPHFDHSPCWYLKWHTRKRIDI